MSMRYRLGVGALVAVMEATTILGGATSAWAQTITGLQNGYLTFTNENPVLYYRVEFKPNLTGPEEWDGAFRGLRNIQSSDPEITVPVGVFYRVAGRDTPWVAGTALESDILSGKTAYVDDVVVTGTMANVGTQDITPGTSPQTITQGYHNGTGSVAGDADLMAGNIKEGIEVFGVTGTHEGGTVIYTNATAAVPKTGQTTSYRAGDDGDLEKGVGWATRFTDHEDGTVTDDLSGLMWTKNANLAGDTRTWDDAIDYCNDMNLGAGTYGYTDWRLPNVRELQSLIDFGRVNPALPDHPFTGVQTMYWSSTSYCANPSLVWIVFTVTGEVDREQDPWESYLWPVRGGQ
ncbi:MAG: DUF1566 domain-containing protein [Verrucomicrobia bacterium]|nr:DUF1566 domain-containing protein [Verrucomicrobiota bacterium]